MTGANNERMLTISLNEDVYSCKCQYKNVGKVEYKNVGFSPYSSVT